MATRQSQRGHLGLIYLDFGKAYLVDEWEKWEIGVWVWGNKRYTSDFLAWSALSTVPRLPGSVNRAW